MKINYDLIKKNLETYKEAKELFPVISEFEAGHVNHSVMQKLGLGQFARFSHFLTTCFKQGYNPVMKGMSWRRLKPILVEETKNERFKTFLSNRTQRQFNEILNDGSTFDRYLNGRWISKPSYTRRGRKTHGRRSHEHIESFRSCIVPILNYIIENNIDVYDDSKDYKEYYSFFKYQPTIENFVCWYTTTELDFSDAFFDQKFNIEMMKEKISTNEILKWRSEIRKQKTLTFLRETLSKMIAYEREIKINEVLDKTNKENLWLYC